MKNVLVIAVLCIGLILAPQIHAQTQAQLDAQMQLTNDFIEGKISVEEYSRRIADVFRIVPLEESTPEAAQLHTPAGKAWVIQDNQVQGSGRAIVFKADGGIEGYVRRLGVWSPHMDNDYSATTYAANGEKINVKSDDEYYGTYTGDYDYTVSGGGSALTITYNEGSGNGGAAGIYSLGDFPNVAAPGGSIVNAPGTAWEISRGDAHDIYHSDGIHYSFGNSVRDSWNFLPNEIWSTYIEPSAGALTRYYHDLRNNKPELFSCSVTDFGGGNKTLRMWRVDRMFPYDEVWKLVPTPSGFQLPKVR